MVCRNDRSPERIAYERDRLDAQEPQTYSADAMLAVTCAGLLGWLCFFALLANLLEWW